ncbi:MAG: alpha-amylase family glycosyl hydrolase [Solirubrobacteraceae bacterium]
MSDGGVRRGGAELRATYRLQLTRDFGFAAARGLVPYLRDLGISHLYLSPSLQSRAGSMHGYDVVDPRRLSDERGGACEFQALADAAHDAGMGIVLDVVPNHMAVDDANHYWTDPALRERFFDIDPATGRWRRFFSVDDLAALRQEDEAVFEETHELVLSLVRDGLVDALRIDHPDGLADPAGYLRRLSERGVGRVWVEKILDPGEQLPDWPVAGTVGYEFLNDVCALFIDPAGEPALTSLWEQVAGDRRQFGEVALECKLAQARGPFAVDLDRLARELRGVSLPGGAGALELAVASLPVYRTYVEPEHGVVHEADRAALAAAQMPAELAQMLLRQREAPAAFVTRFQQTTPGIMAKGVEDTAFYRYCRLLALNDVGGDPSRFGIGVEDFHGANLERARRFPLNMLTTQTHDTKRSGDVRARIGMLASMPSEWLAHVERWMESTASLRSAGAPDDVERYFIFQTLVGALPIAAERVDAYLEKAFREAGRNTNHISPNGEWEAAVRRFCAALPGCERFQADFNPFAARVAAAGDRAALAQLTLKLTVPGIPDIYQGDELPLRSLVDPDNRRPVDWDWRQAMLRRLMGGSPPDAETYKLFLTLRLLGLRARRPAPFAGAYEPLDAGDRTCAFVRGGEVLVAVAIRDGEPEGELLAPRGRWRDVLRGEERTFAGREPVARVLGEYGLAVFERDSP